MSLLDTGVIDTMDGAYALLAAGFDVDDLVDVPDGAGQPCVAAGRNHLLITTYGSWRPLQITLDLLRRRPEPQHAPSWSSILETAFENGTSGPLEVADNELAPSTPTIGVELAAGTFGVRVSTRSAELVLSFYEQGFWPRGTDTEPMEQHYIEVWPL